MILRGMPVVILIVISAMTSEALAQTSSIGARKRQTQASKPVPLTPREPLRLPRNAVYERYSWITAKPVLPRTFKPGDLLTVIVRQRRKFEADADIETKKQYDIKSELDAFIKPTTGGIGAATFHRGKPTISYRFDNELKSEGDTNREDKLTTRLTTTIIDVKPNGLLVIEGRSRLQHDDEFSKITLTGSCRKEDVTAGNTILSTQIANLTIVVENEGAMRAASSRGWIPKLIDLLRPI